MEILSIARVYLPLVCCICCYCSTYAAGGERPLIHLGQQRQTLSSHPRVYLLDNFLNKSDIEYLLEKSRELGLPWFKPLPSYYSNIDRSSNTENVPEEGYFEDPFFSNLEARMEALTNIPLDIASGATIQLAYRNASGKGILDLHHDHNAVAMDIVNAGLPVSRRPSLTMLVATAIGYLSETEEGGETVFPCLCDRASKTCIKNQNACSYLYEHGVLNVHMAGHNTPFKELSPTESKEVTKQAKFLVEAADNLCNFKSKVGIKVTPRTGRVLFFFSNSVRGVADPRAWHGGCKVTKGLKQTMQRFFHAPQGQEEQGAHAAAAFQWGPSTSISVNPVPFVESKATSKPHDWKKHHHVAVHSASRELEKDVALESLDAAQRLVASKWDASCNMENSKRCMAEPIETFVNRTVEKIRRFVAAYPADDILARASVQQGEGNILVTKVHEAAAPYAYNTNQLDDIPAGSTLDLSIPKIPPGVGAFSEVIMGHVRDDGLALLQGVVDRDACRQAMKQLFAWAAAGGSNMTETVQKPKHRHHLRVPLEEPSLGPALNGIFQAVAPTLRGLISPSALLIELAAFITNPGAENQYFHNDVPQSDSMEIAPYYSALLFLTDVVEDGGRFEVVPRTHALSQYRTMLTNAFDNGQKVFLSVPANAGDVLLYDGSILHRGTANRADGPRVVLYMSFVGQGAHPCCHTFAIRTELLEPPAGPLTLEALSKKLLTPHQSMDESTCDLTNCSRNSTRSGGSVF